MFTADALVIWIWVLRGTHAYFKKARPLIKSSHYIKTQEKGAKRQGTFEENFSNYKWTKWFIVSTLFQKLGKKSVNSEWTMNKFGQSFFNTISHYSFISCFPIAHLVKLNEKRFTVNIRQMSIRQRTHRTHYKLNLNFLDWILI